VLDGALVGDSAVVGPNAVVGDDCVIGEASVIGANASIYNCRIGSHSILHPGVRIGQDGFGFTVDEGASTAGARGHAKKPQLRGVLIGSDVEIGANACIDRGSWRDTEIGNGVKLDNLVQIGHNVIIGDHCIIAAGCAIGGSATIGRGVLLGGMSGILQHVVIGDGAKVAARSGVTKSIPPGKTYGGNPAVQIRDYHRQTLIMQQLSRDRANSGKCQ
jgi:UDP-3-O-[3-hydroxymyristoyl] glucosamine N-acyltransferase